MKVLLELAHIVIHKLIYIEVIDFGKSSSIDGSRGALKLLAEGPFTRKSSRRKFV